MKSAAPAYIMNSRDDFQSPIALEDICSCCNEVLHALFMLPVGHGRIAALLELYAIELIAQRLTHRKEKVHEEFITLSKYRFGISGVNVRRIPQMIKVFLPRVEDYLIVLRSPGSSQSNRAIERQIDHVKCTHMIGMEACASGSHQRVKYPKLSTAILPRALDQFLRLYGQNWSQQCGARDYPIGDRQFRQIHDPSSQFFGGILAC